MVVRSLWFLGVIGWPGQMLWGEARGVAKTATMPNPSSCEHDDGENGEMDGNPNLN